MQAHLVDPHEDKRAVSREGDVRIINLARVGEGEEAVEAVAREETTGGDAGEVPVEVKRREEEGEKQGGETFF